MDGRIHKAVKWLKECYGLRGELEEDDDKLLTS